ncbi:MAG: hypothetical protein JWN11_645 [Hyphomicrobiales bacterium]|nr:hypothetical protein [Hyphomicrobiales bacterium]
MGELSWVVSLTSCEAGALATLEPLGLGAQAPPYSTVTDFAKFRGWSTSVPMNTAV